MDLKIYLLIITTFLCKSIFAQNQLHGHIDSVTETNHGVEIRGWACERTVNQPARVRIFLGASGGSDFLISEHKTNRSSGSVIGKICKTSNISHRFLINIAAETANRHKGEAVFIRVLNTNKSSSMLLANSGRYRIPIEASVNAGATPSNAIPSTKQGVSDVNYSLIGTSRQNILKRELSASMFKYNVFWKNFERILPVIDSRTGQRRCNGDSHLLWPVSAEEKERLGVSKYHCYWKPAINGSLNRLRSLSNSGYSIVLGMWATPEMYIHTKCEGSPDPSVLKKGCYPTPGHYDDFADFVSMISSRYGRYIDHYVPWNEVTTSAWADISGEDTKSNLGKSENISSTTRLMAQTFKALLIRTINRVSIADNFCKKEESINCKNMVYVSLPGRIDSTSQPNENNNFHVSGYDILDYLFDTIGLSKDWSIAYHAYDVKTKPTEGLTGVRSLSQYLNRKVIENGAPRGSIYRYPQTRIILHEQNALNYNSMPNTSLEDRAEFICRAHNISMNLPGVISQTHNRIQSPFTLLLQYGQGLDRNKIYQWDMLPLAAGTGLQNRKNYATYQAYLSTNINNWKKSNTHYCCKNHSLGCKTTGRPILSRLNKVANGMIYGWVFDRDQPSASLPVYFYLNGVRIGKTIAKHVHIGVNSVYNVSGNHGFAFRVPLHYRNKMNQIVVKAAEVDSGLITVLD